MSRFTFGLLLGAGAGWAVGSGKAADWKRSLDERRASQGRGTSNSTFPAPAATYAESMAAVSPDFATPQGAAL